MRGPSERISVDSARARAALERVCASAAFAGSPKLTSFLRYVVDTTLAGHGDRLKGYTIAVEALGRGADFDPQADPIVRVEATRLRRALGRYYGGEGASDPVLIELPLGGYRPRFRWGRRAMPLLIWLMARGMLQRLLAAEGPPLLPPPRSKDLQPSDGRQIQQAEGAPAARPCRPWTRRDRGDAAHDRGDPRGL